MFYHHKHHHPTTTTTTDDDEKEQTFVQEKSNFFHRHYYSNISSMTTDIDTETTNNNNYSNVVIVPIHRHLLDQHIYAFPKTTTPLDSNDRMVSLQIAPEFFHNVSSSFMNQTPLLLSSLPNISLEAYSCSSMDLSLTHYQQRLEEALLLDDKYDTVAFDEILLDFWDEHFPSTKGIWFYDKSTPIPRPSYLTTFLTTPCPPHWGTIQCEIERIIKKKSSSPFKSPIYDYRLFIHDGRFTPHNHRQRNNNINNNSSPRHYRQDTLLMVAQSETENTKRSSPNSYHLYSPRPSDVQSHFISINSDHEYTTKRMAVDNHFLKAPKKAALCHHEILGRLDSNSTSDEFQIFAFPSIENNNPGSDDHQNQQKNTNEIIKPNNKTIISKRFSRNQSKRKKKTNNHESTMKNATKREGDSMVEIEERGAVFFKPNLLGNRPRLMDVCIPKVEETSCVESDIWKRQSLEESMVSWFKQAQKADRLHPDPNFLTQEAATFGLIPLQNRLPWWNGDLGAFVLNFGGRVSVPSIKNFQLCDENDTSILQFGRVSGRHSFTLDFQFPFSPLQAFAIAVSALQSNTKINENQRNFVVTHPI